nr:MAG TPA: hypothetical protein [Caudoviricetes sp.]
MRNNIGESVLYLFTGATGLEISQALPERLLLTLHILQTPSYPVAFDMNNTFQKILLDYLSL